MTDQRVQPIDIPIVDIDLRTHGLTGWPKLAPCECGDVLHSLWSTYDHAVYECRGPIVDRQYTRSKCGGKIYRFERAPG